MANESKSNLWSAVQLLMHQHYGKENLNRLARETNIALGTASRMKAQDTSVGLDVIDRIAEKFKVEPWQLLLPDFNPHRPAQVSNLSPMALDLAQMLDAIPQGLQRNRAYALMVQVAEFGAGLQEIAPTRASEPMKSLAPLR